MKSVARLVAPAEDVPLGRIVLKDGSVATLRATSAADAERMWRFFRTLSPESRHQRFFATGEPSDALIARFCDSSDPARTLTLVVSRTFGSETRFLGVGTYVRDTGASAEVAFAVDDGYRGRGLATALLERLAIEAARRGIRTLWAAMLPDNSLMMEVFRASGFDLRSRDDRDGIEIELSLAPTETSVATAEARARMNAAASLTPMLRPRSVAVLGVSRDAGGIGRRIIEAIQRSGYRGAVYAVNPRLSDLNGTPAFVSVQDVPRPVDLAVIAVPRLAVLQAVDDCAAAGVRALVVVTAGFAETGDAGKQLQHRLTDKVRGYGMRMVGPNCMGLLNADPAVALNATFSPVFPPAGQLALSSQSGALGVVILGLASRRHVGLSSFVSIGNRADVSSNDLLEYWETDPTTSVIALYLESFGNPRRFARLARRIGRAKPIVAVKSGRSHAGSRAASSHTAALAAVDVAVDALFHQTGVIRADTIDEMFDVTACLVSQPLPAGRRVGIVTNAGGPGILAVDACAAAGLSVVELTAETRKAVSRSLPEVAALANPVDMIASAGPDEYRATITTMLQAREIDALVILYTPVNAEDTDRILRAIEDGIAAGRAAGATGKPIVACLMTDGDPQLRAGAERIPVYAFPENAARALGKIATYAAWRTAPAGVVWAFDEIRADVAGALCREAMNSRADGWLTPQETVRLLESCGLPIVTTIHARSAAEAVAAAECTGFPVAAKLVSTQAIHKSELDGVRLGLDTAAGVAAAFASLAAAALAHQVSFDGVTIQRMVAAGIETLIGVVHDPLFGPLISFGLGGTEVEVLGDVRFRVAPVTDGDIDDLIGQTRAATLLAGYRGRPPADINAVRDLLARVSCLAERVPEILEIDLNPVIVAPAGRGCAIVDARVRVGRAHSA